MQAKKRASNKKTLKVNPRKRTHTAQRVKPAFLGRVEASLGALGSERSKLNAGHMAQLKSISAKMDRASTNLILSRIKAKRPIFESTASSIRLFEPHFKAIFKVLERAGVSEEALARFETSIAGNKR